MFLRPKGEIMGESEGGPTTTPCCLRMTKTRTREEEDQHLLQPRALLGKGGFARVYEVTSSDGGKVYADKMIRRDFLERKQGSKAKVETEIRLHKDLQHPHIVRLLHSFSDDLYIHILLEKCSLKSLYHLVRSRKALTETEVRFYVKQICEEFATFIDRDPSSGLEAGQHIGDFGLAMKVDGSLKGQAQSSSGKFSLCGTPNYIAPEVLARLGHHRPADIWAVGCMTYAMLFGSPPFETKSLSKTYARIASNNYSIPKRSISLSTKAFIKKLLDPVPEMRGSLYPNGDLFQEPFFKRGFLPRRLPLSAMATPPKFPNPSLRPAVFPVGLKLKLASIFSYSNSSSSATSSSSSSSSANSSSSSIHSSLKTSSSSSSILSEALEHLRSCISQSSGGKDLDFPSPVEFIPVFVTKWIDYSNKHGFGYRLSDGSVGAYLNDGSHISSLYEEDKNLLEFSSSEQCFTFSPESSLSSDLLSRVQLLNYLSRYMAKNLASSNPCAFATQVTLTTPSPTSIPLILKWWRTQGFLLMILNNESIQVNFIPEHIKVVLWKAQKTDVFASFFASKSLPITFHLRALANKSSLLRTNIGSLLQRVLSVLEDLNGRSEVNSSA
ncbi:Pololike kinase 1 [Caligus rogercresseyi]|uniref:Pololike kinase 1 n=1 Tax=Caligus rogercresseyi TaxID=217165 RepID=A0A7T8GNM0_CALRO|nr:Pololike kinase 1 [Caligus rogercresseyi]